MKICDRCGYQNWTPLFVKVKKFSGKVQLCDGCGRRIDTQAPQCDPITGHAERTSSGGADLDGPGRSTSVGILSSGGGEKDE